MVSKRGIASLAEGKEVVGKKVSMNIGGLKDKMK